MTKVAGRSFSFTRAIVRKPGATVASGLRAGDAIDPDFSAFLLEHQGYVAALEASGVEVTVLPALEAFPDSVFVEDVAVCAAGIAVVLRPRAPTRRGETQAIRTALDAAFDTVLDLPGDGFIDGGDVLLADDEALIGLSDRTDRAGFEALSAILSDLGYRTRPVRTPPGILHFKTDCGLLDSTTVFATPRLAATGCFGDYRVIETPDGEEAAANLLRVNQVVLISAGFPRTEALLKGEGFCVRKTATTQAARIDGGLSCMSLRF